MHRRLHAQLAPLILLPLLAGGCVQMTRHSNMMIFGTNTVVGVRAGVNATSVPEVAIGYTRQEAVILPLVANVSSTIGEGGTTAQTVTDKKTGNTTETVTTRGGRLNRLEPCDMSKPLDETGLSDDTRPFRVHPCALIAINDKMQDSYSVLASFGGNFDARYEQGKLSGSVGVAQYFATGMAAQLLALNGGAAVVAGGSKPPSDATGPVTLSGLSPSNAEMIEVRKTRLSYQTWIAGIAAQIKLAPDRQTLDSQIAAFETALGAKETLTCTTIDDCANRAVSERWHFTDFELDNIENLNVAAKEGWPNFKPGV